ncbi:TAFII55 protein conserved region-domain-containing protein [Dichotomocladium elegans]|nr:TAFII55 protein conserved region-domain-containing protein [Dichotomocladium elegans]
MEISASVPKEGKPKVRRARGTSGRSDGGMKDKPIKIKLTTRDNNVIQATMSGSEDEDEPEPAIEEHLILRMPQGELADKLREQVRKREISDDVKLHFRDSRRGYFFLDGKRYDTTLVDLPTIIESQKTLDNKQFYKIADISQMLIVDDGSHPRDDPPARSNTTDSYTFEDGLTPPLKHVRRRRFRQRLSKRAIEDVEREVERLLEVDATAEDVQYEVFDNREMEMEMEMESDVGTQDIDIDTSEAADSESDEDLAAAIDREMEELDEEDREDEEEEDEEESEEDEDEDETGNTGEIEQKKQEIAEIKQAIQRKTADLHTAPNAILRKRFEADLEKLKKELALKEAYLAEMSKSEKK